MCTLALNGFRNVALASEEEKLFAQSHYPQVLQILRQLFKPNFNHPNNPQLSGTISLSSYFKHTPKQKCFPPKAFATLGSKIVLCQAT